VGTDSIAGGALAQVLAELWRKRVGSRPVGVLGERVAVQVRRYVALAAGVGVGPPGPADLLVALEYHEVLDAGLLEADRHAQAPEPGAQDHHSELASVSCGHVVSPVSPNVKETKCSPVSPIRV